MKRLMSLILTVAITLSAMTIIPVGASAAKNTKIDEMLAVLSYLDIVSTENSTEIDLEKVVDRATFSQMMAAAIKANYNSGTIYFADVPKEHWANSYISALTDLGIISLAEDRMFEPERAIKYAEACKMLVCALGYEKMMNAQDSSMSKWTTQASKLDIAAENNGDTITMATAIELVFEAMEAPMLAYESFPYTLIKDENTTLFGTVHDVYRGRGIVQSVYGAYMQGKPLYEENKAMVSGDEYNVDDALNMKDHFAHEVDFYYVHDDKMDENKIFYAKNRSNEDFVEIEGTFITSFDASSYTLTYYETEDARRTKTARIEKSAQIVLNGAPYSGSLKDAIDKFINEERRGTVTLFSLNGSGYDFVNIKSYEPFIVTSYDSEKMLLGGGFEYKQIDLSDVDVLTVKDDIGMDTDIGSIKKTVLNLAQSENNEIVEIIGSPIALTVKVDSYVAGDREITCGETTYKVDKHIWDSYVGRFTSLGSIQIKTDMFGYVVDIVGVADDDWRIGYLIKARCFEEIFDEYQIVFRLYTTDAKIENLYFAEKINIDGNSYKLSKAIYPALDAIPDSSYNVSEDGRISLTVKDQIVRYKLNSDGKIKNLDTYNVGEKEDKESSLTRKHDRTDMLHIDGKSRYGLDTCHSSSKTKYFTVPIINSDGSINKNGTTTEPTEKDFSLKMTNAEEKTYNLSVYDTNMNDIYSEILVSHGGDSADGYIREAIIFDHMNQIWDEETEEVAGAVIGYQAGKEVEYYISESMMDTFNKQNISFGDMFHINVDGNYISSITKCVEADDASFTNGSGDNTWYIGGFDPSKDGMWSNYRTDRQLERFYIYRKLPDGIMGTYNQEDMYDGKSDITFKSSGVSVTVVDMDSETIETATIDSLQDYYSTGTVQEVISLTVWTTVKALVIYK